MTSRRAIVAVGAAAALGLGLFFVLFSSAPEPAVMEPVETTDASPQRAIIGRSVQGRNIEAYSYGNGATRLLFVGGVHGGYEWNSVLLAYAAMDHLAAHPEAIPANLTATVIGKYVKLGTTGRVNAAVGLPNGSPGIEPFWAYLGAVAGASGSPFGTNPHALVL